MATDTSVHATLVALGLGTSASLGGGTIQLGRGVAITSSERVEFVINPAFSQI